MNLQYELGYQVLGPIFRFFCFRLRLIEQYKSETPLLFLSRGGIRLHHFYESYLHSNSLQPLAPQHDFYISRMAAFRALLAVKSEYAAKEIAKEYGSKTQVEAMSCFLPINTFKSWQNSDSASVTSMDDPISPEHLLNLTSPSTSRAVILHDHFTEQHRLLTQYLNLLVGDCQEAVLVDTGWSGSIINSLKKVFPQKAFTAAFFGRFNYGKPPPPWFDSISGLVMQNEYYNAAFPQSAIAFHRHLVEGLCEPVWPSVEYFVSQDDKVLPASGVMPSHVKKPGKEETMAFAVHDFIVAEPEPSVQKVIEQYGKAISNLARLIKYPNSLEAVALSMPPRSADFGRNLKVPVLIPKSLNSTRINRIKQSLWRQGQVAQEFGLLRWPMQFLITLKSSRFPLLIQLRQLLRRRRPGP